VLLKHQHVWLIVDDIHEHIVSDDFRFVTPAAIEPGAAWFGKHLNRT